MEGRVLAQIDRESFGFEIASGLFSRRHGPRQFSINLACEASNLRSIEIHLAVLVAPCVKLAALDHSQYRPAPAMKRFRHIFYGETVAWGRFWFGRSEAGIKQIRQAVLEDCSSLARVGARQFRAQLDRRFSVDN
jgi:hypothetical protein